MAFSLEIGKQKDPVRWDDFFLKEAGEKTRSGGMTFFWKEAGEKTRSGGMMYARGHSMAIPLRASPGSCWLSEGSVVCVRVRAAHGRYV